MTETKADAQKGSVYGTMKIRATQSLSLYIQQVGAVTRKAPGEAYYLLLDFGGNVVRHGQIDAATQQKDG